MYHTWSILAAVSALTQSTTVTAKSLKPRNDILCAWPGYDAGKPAIGSSTNGTYPACSAACFALSNCKSFAFTKGDCELYDVPVEENFVNDYASPYVFYDIGCEKTFSECGLPGYDYNWRTYDYSSNFTSSACASRCLSQSNCKSYGFGNGECFLYEYPVSGNLNGKQSSPYKFFDRSCINSSSSSTTTTTKTTSKSPTTTQSTASPTKPSTTTITTKQSTTTTITKASTQTGSTTTKASVTTATTTTTKIMTTTVTISNQPFYCTAVNK